MSQGLSMVGWRDYQGVDGFGQTTVQDLVELRKALAAGNDRDPPASFAPGDGFALRVESLENTLANTTYRMEHVRFWKAIPKRPAYNTVEEFNQITSYGDANQPAWIGEFGLPAEVDSTYVRNYKIVKFLGVLKRVSHVASLVKPAHGNVIAQETIAGTMQILRQLEQNLFEADSSLDSIQWDGVDKQISDGAPASNIIDLRGQPLSEDVLIDAALTIQDAPNYGVPTHLFMNPKHKADLVKSFFPKSRYDLFNKTDSGRVGLDINGFTSPAGDVSFEPDVFINVTPLVPSAAVGDAAQRPGQPTSLASATATSASTQFAASDYGNYWYQVVAVNQYGKSAPRSVAAAVTVGSSANQVTLTINPADASASYYEIYRTEVGGAASTARRIKRVAANGASAVNVVDLNEDLPNTASAYMFQMDMDNMHFAQLAPMVKIPLATIDTSIRWMQLLYGTPIIRSPGRNVIFRNVGRATGYVGAV